MSKQIKLGFDKTPIKSYDSDQILVDGRGIELTDELGNPLYTRTDSVLPGALSVARSTSMIATNRGTPEVRSSGSLPIKELFPEASEVSSSLLGIPRLGKQQGIFSDVSIYGLNENDWEYFRAPEPFQPTEWSTRNSKIYGKRGGMSLLEVPEEQALAIRAFPVQFTFPYGPNWQASGRYRDADYQRYVNFIELGNLLYNYYFTRNFQSFARENFLNPIYALAIATGSSGVDDVEYSNENRDRVFEEIENWTLTYQRMISGRLVDPLSLTGELLTITRSYNIILNLPQKETRPGYFENSSYYGQLQSKEAFRYQPGSASGFTFGVRVTLDSRNADSTFEWGCANDTDQYMFQLKGERFSIVRRSTVPLSIKSLEENGLRQENQIVNAILPNPFERSGSSAVSEDPFDVGDTRIRYETLISQDNFNGDKVNGTGDSRYRLSFNEVTMFKIEFSWYGAIGAKFYVYVPVGNSEARWVLMHTLIIENTLPEPSLRNPYFKFRYCVYLNQTSGVESPLFLYKYGASYYIDGDDEGTFTYSSYSSNDKNIISQNSIPVIGILPKNKIFNSDGISNINQKNFYVEKINVTSTKTSRVDVLECEGCLDGFGHYYAPRILNGLTSQEQTFQISSSGTELIIDPDNPDSSNVFTFADDGKKIIGPGIFCSYIRVLENPVDPKRAKIVRRTSAESESLNTPIDENSNYSSNIPISVANENIFPIGYKFTGRLSGYDDTIGATNVISKRNFIVNFLNPISRETTGQWREFRIGITNKRPVVSNGNLKFQLSTEDPEFIDADRDSVYAEFTPREPSRNTAGAENGESDTRIGNIMVSDYRLNDPRGINSGRCSRLNGTIKEQVFDFDEYSTTNPATGESGHFLLFNQPSLLDISLTDGEFGIESDLIFIASGQKFLSDLISYSLQDGELVFTRYYVRISGPATGFSQGNGGKIILRSLRIFGRYVNKEKIFSFDVFPLYIFIQCRDNAIVNNIVVTEFDESSTFSFIPSWITTGSNIQIQQYSNTPAGSDIPDAILGSTEYNDLNGFFRMGGFTSNSSPPSNFQSRIRLNSVLIDDVLSLPLRPAIIKKSFFVGENKSNTISMKDIFGIDRYKLTTGEFNNKSLYISAKAVETNVSGNISISISGKEQ
jgi:hypothetical protein